jgi:hypothetical protein
MACYEWLYSKPRRRKGQSGDGRQEVVERGRGRGRTRGRGRGESRLLALTMGLSAGVKNTALKGGRGDCLMCSNDDGNIQLRWTSRIWPASITLIIYSHRHTPQPAGAINNYIDKSLVAMARAIAI